jgi:hypothetical protein
MPKAARSGDRGPPPLPPETRTVGQLVAESVRLYRERFWPSLALGIGPALFSQLVVDRAGWTWILLMATLGAVVFTVSYTGATAVAAARRFERRRWLLAILAGVIAFIPFPFLASVFVLPGLAWLALVGLVVPVVLIEGKQIRAAFSRALELSRADYVHALGSLAALTIVVVVTYLGLFFVLRGTAETTARAAAFLANLVLAPLLFLGAALLYYDQEARVRKS